MNITGSVTHGAIGGAGGGSTTPATSGHPFLVRSSSDVMAYVGQATLNHAVAIGYSSKVVSFGVETTLKSRTFSSGAWGDAVACGTGTEDATCVFLDSSGNVYVSGANSRELCRSADDGATWTVVLDSTDLPAGHEIRTMTEDSSGNLYANHYGTTVGLWKSTDSGVTWTQIVSTSFPGSGVTPSNHIHSIFYDPHRGVLLCGHGDVSGSYIQVSGDEGVTWSSWANSDQAVGIAFDADYIYYNSDLSGDRGIYRSSQITGTGVSAVTAATVSKVFDVTTLADIAADNDAGHCWWGYVNDGVVMFAYGAAGSGTATGAKAHLMTSSDQGTTWSNTSESQTYAENSNTTVSWAHDFALPSYYARSLWDGFFYHKADGLSNDYITRWKMYPRPATITVDPTNGVDYITETQATLLEVGLPPGIEQKLIGNLTTDHIQNGLPGALINKNGYTFTDNGTVSAHRVQNLDGAYSESWADSTNGTGSWETTIKYEGTGSRKFVLTSGQYGNAQRVNVFSKAVGAGEENAWMQYQFYPATYTPTGTLIIAQIVKTSDAIYIQETSGVLEVKYNFGTATTVKSDTGVSITQNDWNKIKIHWYRHATQGRIRAWVGGKLIADIQGINSYPNTATGDYTVACGVSGAPTAGITIYVDDIKCSYADPEEPTDITLTATGQKVIPDGVYS